jgi:peptide deformylase
MIRPIFTYPKDKDILTTPSVEVKEFNDEIKQIIEDLVDTVKANGGAGISAIQIGKPYRICVINWGGITVLVNPTITRSRGVHTMREGCLSVPGLYVETPRYQKVWVSALNENGEEIEYAEGGNGSYIVQHEMDHFGGYCTLFDAYDKVMKEQGANDKSNQENQE